MMDPASTSNILQENGGSRKERDKIPLCTIHKFHSLILTVNIPIFLQLYQSTTDVSFATFTHKIWQKVILHHSH